MKIEVLPGGRILRGVLKMDWQIVVIIVVGLAVLILSVTTFQQQRR
jgi:hypothetical protein